VARTIKIIFVKPSGVGLLLEGEDLTKYNNLHNQAIEAYKRASRMLEKIRGATARFEYEIIDPVTVANEDLQVPANKIIIVKDDGTTLLLEKEAFTSYQEHHFQGLKLLKEKPEKIQGQTVRVTFL